MPNNKQAKKRLRQDERRRVLNRSKSTRMKNAVKQANTTFGSSDVNASKDALREAVKRIDKAAKAGVIHRNTAARKKSSLARQLRDLEKSGQGS